VKEITVIWSEAPDIPAELRVENFPQKRIVFEIRNDSLSNRFLPLSPVKTNVFSVADVTLHFIVNSLRYVNRLCFQLTTT
jgi:hypothetical protein